MSASQDGSAMGRGHWTEWFRGLIRRLRRTLLPAPRDPEPASRPETRNGAARESEPAATVPDDTRLREARQAEVAQPQQPPEEVEVDCAPSDHSIPEPVADAPELDAQETAILTRDGAAPTAAAETQTVPAVSDSPAVPHDQSPGPPALDRAIDQEPCPAQVEPDARTATSVSESRSGALPQVEDTPEPHPTVMADSAHAAAPPAAPPAATKTDRRRIPPEKRGGRPRDSSETGGAANRDVPRGPSERLPVPELVCVRDGMAWTIGVEVPDELAQRGCTVSQAPFESNLGEHPGTAGLYSLSSPLGAVTVRCASDRDTAQRRLGHRPDGGVDRPSDWSR